MSDIKRRSKNENPTTPGADDYRSPQQMRVSLTDISSKYRKVMPSASTQGGDKKRWGGESENRPRREGGGAPRREGGGFRRDEGGGAPRREGGGFRRDEGGGAPRREGGGFRRDE
ncbi:MAG: hypothetical protein ACRCTY_09140, partial [Candidatus Adiutrix sp.]